MTEEEKNEQLIKCHLTEEEFDTVNNMLKELTTYCQDHNINLITDGPSGTLYAVKCKEFYVSDDTENDIDPPELTSFFYEPISASVDREYGNDRIHIVEQ